ncbi:hypothetical protein [Arthrobacter sp. StoSoilB22]|uniref:hypothetical protein n=1 Tax=Arthrobacter sp. StoSoilB22 TaxID=2830996 RepID=UPI001CC73A4B|nr:hypothetical protein [Arthrobacter sp. StoSoilB22]BCW61852.1 hypothetical protein StoSoilB22_08250 [Arthrobacter sp. StoSoilB22]
MPRLTTESFGSGNMSWVGSEHAINNARTAMLDISAFTANTHYPDGYIPSGTAVAEVDDLLVPYVATEGTVTGAGILAGFVLTDQKVVGTSDFPVPLFDHGRVKTANLPIAFTKPAAAAKLSATTIVFV